MRLTSTGLWPGDVPTTRPEPESPWQVSIDFDYILLKLNWILFKVSVASATIKIKDRNLISFWIILSWNHLGKYLCPIWDCKRTPCLCKFKSCDDHCDRFCDDFDLKYCQVIECFTCLKHSPRSPGKAGHGLHRSFCEPACVSFFESLSI